MEPADAVSGSLLQTAPEPDASPAPADPPKSAIVISHAAISDQGPARKTHEDTVAHRVPDDPEVLAQKGAVFVMADGVGGHGGGDIASREAARVFIETYYSENASPERSAKIAVGESNLFVYDLGIKMRRKYLSTTLTALVIEGSRYHIVHVGDTRIYRIRPDTTIELMTDDHSEAGDLVKLNILSPDKVRNHPRRSNLTRSIGSEAVARPMAKSGAVQPGDIFVQLTDGVWELIEDTEIDAIARLSAPDDACKALIDLSLSRSPSDNMSVQVVHVIAIDESAPRNSGGLRGAILRLFGVE